jgi:ATP-binding cassette subfamily B protein RaxB
LARFNSNYSALRSLLFGFELLLVIYVGALSVLQRDLTLDMLFAFMSYRGHFARRVSSFIEQWLEFRSLGVNLDRLAEISLHERETLLI